MSETSHIRTTATHTVTAARRHVAYHRDTYTLGPLDQPVAAPIPVAAVFVYSAPNNDKSIVDAGRLRQAMSLVLDYYPYLAGRLHLDPKDGSYGIGTFDAGAIFTEATCGGCLGEFEPAQPDRLTLAHLPSNGNALLCPFDPTDIAAQPTLSLQHTRFACGSVSLGIRILHKVVDAIGYFMFVRHLLEIYTCLINGEATSLASPPSLSAYIRSTTTPHAGHEDVLSSPYHSTTISAPTLGSFSDTAAIPLVTGRFLSINKSELDYLKQEATSEHRHISSFTALTSFIYQLTHKARLQLRALHPDIPPLSATQYLTSVNVRGLLHLDNYPHNGLITPHVHVPETALASGPLHLVAAAIHDMIKTSLDVETIESSARWIAAQTDKSQIRSLFQYGPGAFMTSAWNRIDMYGPDFEVEGTRPKLVSTPFTPISLVDGLGYFLPTPDGSDGGLEVCLALDDRVWELLDRDERWVKMFGESGRETTTPRAGPMTVTGGAKGQ